MIERRPHDLQARPDWYDHAACKGMDPAWFYPDDPNPHGDAQHIIEFCATCPVQARCAWHGLTSTPVEFGYWGGLSYHKRKRIRYSNPRVLERYRLAAIEEAA